MVPRALLKLTGASAVRRNHRRDSGAVSTTQVLLVAVLVVALMGLFFGIRRLHTYRGGIEFSVQTPYSFTEESPATPIALASQVTITSVRGDITVVPDDTSELRVIARKTVYAWKQSDAQSAAAQVHIAIHDDGGGGYDVRPTGLEALGNKGTISLEVHLPRRAVIRASAGDGNVRVSGARGSVSAKGHNGVIEIRECGGDVSASQSGGSVHIVGVAGNVKVSGDAKELEVADVKGQAAIDGKFPGLIHLARIEMGVHLISDRTDLTITRLNGLVESSPGSLRISDDTGDIALNAQDVNVSITNPGGKVQITGNNGRVEIYYARPPRADISVEHKAGDLSVSLPPQSTFRLNAQTIDGNLNTTFSGLAETGDPEDNNLTLYGQVGANGPMILLHNSFGDINIQRRGF
jgi:DUF4097 and DUF4098 domain-containing protein YvlB